MDYKKIIEGGLKEAVGVTIISIVAFLGVSLTKNADFGHRFAFWISTEFGTYALSCLFGFAVLIFIISILIIRFRHNQTLDSMMMPLQEQLDNLLTEKDKASSKLFGIQSFKIIEECLKNSMSDFDPSIIEKVISEHVTAIPIHPNYLMKRNSADRLILFADSELEIFDKKGTIAHFRRTVVILTLEEGLSSHECEWHFSDGTEVQECVIDGKTHKGNLNGNCQFKAVTNFETPLKKFETKRIVTRATLKNCFISNEENWVTDNKLYPIGFERLKIKLPDKPARSGIKIRNGNNGWTPPGKRTLKLRKDWKGDQYVIEYLNNFQKNDDEFMAYWAK